MEGWISPAAAERGAPEPARDAEEFLMPVQDVFSITGRGTVVTGRIESGTIRAGDDVEIIGMKKPMRCTVTGVEMFRRVLDQGQEGDNVGLLLRGIKPGQVKRGQVIIKPGTGTSPA